MKISKNKQNNQLRPNTKYDNEKKNGLPATALLITYRKSCLQHQVTWGMAEDAVEIPMEELHEDAQKLMDATRCD